MLSFGELDIGDMFNTKTSRWVKTDPDHAICVTYGKFELGTILEFQYDDTNIVVLFSKHCQPSSKNQHSEY